MQSYSGTLNDVALAGSPRTHRKFCLILAYWQIFSSRAGITEVIGLNSL